MAPFPSEAPTWDYSEPVCSDKYLRDSGKIKKFQSESKALILPLRTASREMCDKILSCRVRSIAKLLTVMEVWKMH